jgi:transcriptional regulator with XRE-family HTH domain
MLVTHPFNLALAARGRRRQLKLRQAEVAQAAQVGRKWLVDFANGKPTLELAKVLRTLSTLGVQVPIKMGRSPDWALPLTAAAIHRRARVAAMRPKTRVLKDRADVTPPADWPDRERW